MFPLNNFDISEDLKLFKDPNNEEAAIACLAIDTGDSEHGFLDAIPIANKIITNFAALFSLFTRLTLQVESGNVCFSINDLSDLGKNQSISEWETKVTIEEKSQSSLGETIKKYLSNTKKIWAIFEETMDNNLKKNIINALHYYYFGKNSLRPEEKILNYMIGFECLFLDDFQELTYKLSHRSSYLISNYVELGRIEIFDFIKKMYRLRSKIVHNGEIGEIIYPITFKMIDEYLSISIRCYISLLNSFSNKQDVIKYIEKGLLGEEINFPEIIN